MFEVCEQKCKDFYCFLFFNPKKFTLVYFANDILVLAIFSLTYVLSKSINMMVRDGLSLN